jgi:hypothetical protein
MTAFKTISMNITWFPALMALDTISSVILSLSGDQKQNFPINLLCKPSSLICRVYSIIAF